MTAWFVTVIVAYVVGCGALAVNDMRKHDQVFGLRSRVLIRLGPEAMIGLAVSLGFFAGRLV